VLETVSWFRQDVYPNLYNKYSAFPCDNGAV